MKAYDIIGWAFDGELFHDGCEPAVPEQTDTEEGKSPVFANAELGEGDYCAHCLHTWIAETEPEDRAEGAPSWVLIGGDL